MSIVDLKEKITNMTHVDLIIVCIYTDLFINI